jgi:hypothetical protein
MVGDTTVTKMALPHQSQEGIREANETGQVKLFSPKDKLSPGKEIRKKCDLWEHHVSYRGNLT